MGCFVFCSDDQGFVYKDAIFISTHKLVGGVETPGKVKYEGQTEDIIALTIPTKYSLFISVLVTVPLAAVAISAEIS